MPASRTEGGRHRRASGRTDRRPAVPSSFVSFSSPLQGVRGVPSSTSTSWGDAACGSGRASESVPSCVLAAVAAAARAEVTSAISGSSVRKSCGSRGREEPGQLDGARPALALNHALADPAEACQCGQVTSEQVAGRRRRVATLVRQHGQRARETPGTEVGRRDDVGREAATPAYRDLAAAKRVREPMRHPSEGVNGAHDAAQNSPRRSSASAVRRNDPSSAWTTSPCRSKSASTSILKSAGSFELALQTRGEVGRERVRR